MQKKYMVTCPRCSKEIGISLRFDAKGEVIPGGRNSNECPHLEYIHVRQSGGSLSVEVSFRGLTGWTAAEPVSDKQEDKNGR